MKKLLVVLFVATLGVTVEAQQAPSWMNEMPPDGVLWGVGIAKQSSLGFSKTMAEARARQSIAGQLESCVNSALTDHTEDTTTGVNMVSTSMQEGILRVISSAQLAGSKVINVFQASDGTYYCRIQYSKEEAKRWIRELLKDKGDDTYDEEAVAKYVDSSIDANAGVR
jgi:hypothetical protein